MKFFMFSTLDAAQKLKIKVQIIGSDGSNPSFTKKRANDIYGFHIKNFGVKTPKKPVNTGFKGMTSIL